LEIDNIRLEDFDRYIESQASKIEIKQENFFDPHVSDKDIKEILSVLYGKS